MNDALRPQGPAKAIPLRLRLPYLLKRFQARYVWAAFVFVNCFITMVILAGFAYALNLPLVFPSLGPTAFLLFLTPRAAVAKPRNALIGHAIGIICGYMALVVTGLAHAPSIMSEGVTTPRILASGLALALTGAIMVIAKSPHPPAGATTLIIALGFIIKPLHLVIIEVAVGVLILQALAIYRLAGINAPHPADSG